jgi:hypothetical protein
MPEARLASKAARSSSGGQHVPISRRSRPALSPRSTRRSPPDGPTAPNWWRHKQSVSVPMRTFPVTILCCICQLWMSAVTGYASELEGVEPVFQRAIPNIPGKSLVAIVVSYPPGGRSLPHHHAKSALSTLMCSQARSRADWIANHRESTGQGRVSAKNPKRITE